MKKYHYCLRLYPYIPAVIITPHTMHAATEIERTIELARLITECDADTFHEQLTAYQRESTWQDYRQTTAQLKELALQLTEQKQATIRKRLQKTGKRVFSGFSGIALLIFVAGQSHRLIGQIADIKIMLRDIYDPKPCNNAIDIQNCWGALDENPQEKTRVVMVQQKTISIPATPAHIVRRTAITQLLSNGMVAAILLSVGYKAVLDLHYARYANTQKLTEEIKSLHTIIEDLQC